MNNIIPRTMESGGARIPPGRMMPITRVPEREEKRIEKENKASFTMYIDTKNCRHSRELLRLVKDDHKIPCTIVDISVEGIPSWLTGTPNIVVGTDVYCGDTAFQYIESSMQSSVNNQTNSSVHDIVSGKGKKDNSKGCGLDDAFCAPPQINEEESSAKHSVSLDAVMSRMMADRK